MFRVFFLQILTLTGGDRQKYFKTHAIKKYIYNKNKECCVLVLELLNNYFNNEHKVREFI